MSRYWKVTGETRKKVLQTFIDRMEMHKTIMKFVKKHGGDRYVHSNGIIDHFLGMTFKKGKEPEDDKTWKRKYSRKQRTHTDYYAVVRKTKVGKELAAKVAKFRLPGRYEISTILGVTWGSLPGYRLYGKAPRHRVVVVTNDQYNPKKKIADEVVRISDIEAERLEAADKKKKK